MNGLKVLGLAGALALVACGQGHVAGGSVDQGSSQEAVTAHKCPNGPTVSGIDVSEFQGTVNWSQVHSAGQVFAIARVSDGTGRVDPTFDTNWAGIQAAGMIRGAYQFFEPAEDPIAQANLVISHVGQLGAGDLPVMLDVEVTGGRSASAITSAIHTWINAVQAGTGKTPFIYTGAYFWDASVVSADFKDLPLDVAWYGTNCPGTPNAWSGWTLHQFSSTGRVAGISGNVDLEVYNGSLQDLQNWVGQSAPPPPPPPVPTSCGLLDSGTSLGVGQSVTSCDGRFVLVLQGDGNLVLYQNSPFQALWATGTFGQSTAVAAMQSDGNFVLYDGQSQWLWQSGTSGSAGAALVVQDDGNVVIYSANNDAIWSSQTGGR